MDKTIAEIMSFWDKVGLYEKGCKNKQLAKIREEFLEMMNAFYECYYVDKSKANLISLQKEIGDLFIATMNLCEIVGFDIETCAKLSHHKNESRTYYMRGSECVRDK